MKPFNAIAAAAIISSSLIAITPADAFWGEKTQENYSWTSRDKWTNEPTRHGVSLHSGSYHGEGQKADLICDLKSGLLRIELPARWVDRQNNQVKIAFNNKEPITRTWALNNNNKVRQVSPALLDSLLNSSIMKIAWAGNFIQIDLKRYNKSIQVVSKSCF